MGLLWVFHNHPDSSPMTNELVYSRDGLQYRRAMSGAQFVPLGSEGSFDSKMIAPVALIGRAGECLIYYNGRNSDHGSDRRADGIGGAEMQPGHCPEGEPPMGGLGLARLPMGHFCGVRADFDGMVESSWLCNYGRSGVRAALQVEAGGAVRAEVLDPYGRVLPGFGRDASRARQQADGTWSFSWGAGLTGTCGEASAAGGRVGHVVKLRFHLHRAVLYGFAVGEEGAAPAYIS